MLAADRARARPGLRPRRAGHRRRAQGVRGRGGDGRQGGRPRRPAGVAAVQGQSSTSAPWPSRSVVAATGTPPASPPPRVTSPRWSTRCAAHSTPAPSTALGTSMAESAAPSGRDGLVVVDKPAGLDLARRRRAGCAGWPAPARSGTPARSTRWRPGCWSLGVGRATRLLGHLALHDKAYDATIRLGQSTVTDDAEGDVTGAVERARASPRPRSVRRGRAVRGEIEQVPSAVSAIKVDGVALLRPGPSRREGRACRPPGHRHRVRRAASCGVRPTTCSTSTCRSTARAAPTSGPSPATSARRSGSAGTSPRCGAPGSAASISPRRTPSNSWRSISRCCRWPMRCARRFPQRTVDGDDAVAVRHGRPLAPAGETGITGIFDGAGEVLALMEPRGDVLRVVVGFTGS